MEYLLAVDGGGTGCRAALADAQGRVLARANGGPANIASDPETAARNLLSVCDNVLLQALGLSSAGSLPPLHVVMGLAGSNATGSVARIRAALPFVSLRIETDAVIAVKGALHDSDGIVAALGTGSVFARQWQGVMKSIGGHGLALGDEASGAWLGRSLLSLAVLAEDGLGDLTPLLKSILDEFGGVEGVTGFSLTARPADYARLAPRIVLSADPAAMTLLNRAAADVAAYVGALQTDPPLPVVFLGSLGPALAQRVTLPWQVRPPLGNALDGALQLALQHGRMA